MNHEPMRVPGAMGTMGDGCAGLHPSAPPPDWLNRRAKVEEEMLEAARGRRPMPDAAKLKEWAARLGVPSEYHAICRSIPRVEPPQECLCSERNGVLEVSPDCPVHAP